MRFRVLGPVAAYNDRGPVPLGSARQRTVLAVLLTEPGSAVSFDQLVDRVWGEAPPQRARQTLHTYLSRLRTALSVAGGPVLARRSHSYALEAEGPVVDLHRFRTLAGEARLATDDDRAAALWCDALELWQGAPFADLDSDWLRMVGLGWEAERLAAVLDRTDVLLRRGEHARLVPELSAAAAAHPLDERLAGQLMLALYRCGRQADALACYRQIHDRLVEELGSDPGPALREMHRRILRQEAPAPRPTAAVTVVADRPAAVGAQLPADIAGFTGRAVALRQLDTLLGPAAEPASTVVISAIGGCAGVGKTALAVRWAHRVADRFPDGQLYVNLRGYDPAGQAMGPGEALRTLLELLQVPPAQIPTSAEAMAGCYRSRLAGARMLVVLDNARDAEQVRPLLPGTPGSMALVTSRNQLAGLVATDAAHPVRLDVLDPAEARLLLTRRLGADRVAAEPAAVDQIIAACAGLPLALAIVTARVATRPGFPLAGFAAELADARDRLDALAGPDAATDVRAVFACSYRALSRPAARLFRLLGPHPGPDLGLPAAASLAATPPAQVRRLLAELTAAHLLTEPTPGRYTFHDLLRTYATELADSVDPATEQREAIHRALDYYLHSANAADRWLPSSRERITLPQPQPGSVPECFASNAEARRWLTVELPVLAAAVRHGGEAGFDRHVQQLACALAIFLLWGGLWHHHFEIQEAGLRAARRLADQSAEAIIHRNIAHAHVQLGRHDDAHRHIRKALALYQALGDDAGQARVQFGLTWLAEQQDRYQDGLDHAQRCLAAAELAGHRVLQALARNAVGWCHTLLGDHKQAIRHCEQALAELSELDEPGGMADVWNSLGRAHQQLGNHQAAIGYYRQAVDRCREIGSPGREATHLTHLGDAYEASGDAAAAREAWQAALELFDEIGHPDTDELRKRLE